MSRMTVKRTIHAPVELVFKTVSDINNFSKAVPHIVSAEILSDTKSGVGKRFRETRLMNGKETKTVLEVTEFVENDRVRMVADSHGTVWDSLFTVTSAGGKHRARTDDGCAGSQTSSQNHESTHQRNGSKSRGKRYGRRQGVLRELTEYGGIEATKLRCSGSLRHWTGHYPY